MLIAPDGSCIIDRSPLWVGGTEPEGFWRLEAPFDGAPKFIPGPPGEGSLLAGADGWFAVSKADYSAGHFQIHAMQFDDLTAIKARTSWPSAGGPTGEERAWQCLPPFWLAPMKVGEGRVEAMRLTEKGELHPLRFEWFWNGPYDHGYSFPAIVRAHPTTGDLVVGMYRSDHVVFCDPMSGAQRQVLCLEENQHSSTMIDFDQASDTMWVRGYDTLFRFSLQSLRKQRSRRLQEGGLYQNQIMTAQFIGEFVLQPERNRVCVARPFSGDVIALDWESLETVAVAMTGGQPLFLAMFDDLVVARDWKTGGVLRAVLT